jgi:hypothetical protein
MGRLLCAIGLHDFRWPPHTPTSWGLWDDYDVECARGCGARTVLTCHHRTHWAAKHPEPADD